MKKLLYAAIAAIGLLLSPACSNEDELSNDNEALVSFNVGVENGMQTKAAGAYTIGNANLINTLHVRVYYDNGSGEVGEEITDFSKDQSFSGTDNLSFNLLRGQKYYFLFFADHQTSEGSPYTIQDGGAIKVSYDDAKCNDETRDAFVETLSVTATGPFTHSVKLRRPFAQLNFLTTADDIQAAAAGRIVNDIVSSGLSTKVTINNAATSYNPFTKKVNGSTTATFGVNKAPFAVTNNRTGTAASDYTVSSDYGTLSVKGTSGYYYLATTYFLVNTGEGQDATTQTTLNSVKLEVDRTDVPVLNVPSAKVQQNFRTNIYGSLLTDPGNFKVTITPAFEDEHNESANTEDPVLPADPATVYVSSVEELTNALNTNAEVIKLNEMIDLSTDLEVSRSVTIDGQDRTCGFTGAGSVVVKAQAEDAVTFSGVIFNNAADENAVTNTKYALTSVEGIQCDVTVENCVFANYTYGAVFLQPYMDSYGNPVDCSTILIKGNSFTTPSNEIQGDYLKVCSTTTKDGNLRNEWTGGGTTYEPVTATLKILNNTFGRTADKVEHAIYTKFISRYTTYVGGNQIDNSEGFDTFKGKLDFNGISPISLPDDFQTMFTGEGETPLKTTSGS